MRFVLDNDTDAALVGLFVRAGHDAWTAADAGLAGVDSAEDDEVSVYADERDAIVITHDREYTRRRKRNTFGLHVFLRCEQPDAYEIVAHHLDEIEELLNSRDSGVVTVSREGAWLDEPRWT